MPSSTNRKLQFVGVGNRYTDLFGTQHKMFRPGDLTWDFIYLLFTYFDLNEKPDQAGVSD